MAEGRPGRALIRLGRDTLVQLLGLPDGMRVVAVNPDFPSSSILLMVESADLPQAPPDTAPPELGGYASTEYLLDCEGEDEGRGRLWVRWQWWPASDTPPVPEHYMCGIARCSEQGVMAIATRTRRSVADRESRWGALLLCATHSAAPPDSWREWKEGASDAVPDRPGVTARPSQ